MSNTKEKTEQSLKELKIILIKDLFDIPNITIPYYQRPYRWNYKTANTLLNDIIEARNRNILQYRIGTVILHKDKDNNYNIVDGQQRLTTLSILLYCIDNVLNVKAKETEKYLLGQKYSNLSYDAININYNFYKRRINEFSNKELEDIKKYILGNCELVQVVTDSEQEAFQFMYPLAQAEKLSFLFSIIFK